MSIYKYNKHSNTFLINLYKVFLDCHKDVCDYSCKLSKPKLFNKCYTHCLHNINQSPRNQKATKILAFWTILINNQTKHQDFTVKGKGNMSLEEEIEEREADVERVKKELLNLEEKVLKLRKRKVAELNRLKHK